MKFVKYIALLFIFIIANSSILATFSEIKNTKLEASKTMISAKSTTEKGFNHISFILGLFSECGIPGTDIVGTAFNKVGLTLTAVSTVYDTAKAGLKPSIDGHACTIVGLRTFYDSKAKEIDTKAKAKAAASAAKNLIDQDAVTKQQCQNYQAEAADLPKYQGALNEIKNRAADKQAGKLASNFLANKYPNYSWYLSNFQGGATPADRLKALNTFWSNRIPDDLLKRMDLDVKDLPDFIQQRNEIKIKWGTENCNNFVKLADPNKVDFISKVVAGFKTLLWMYKCVDKTSLIQSLVVTAVGLLVDWALNAITLGFIKGVKYAWIVARCLYFVYKLYKSTNDDESSTLSGNAVGTVVRILFTALGLRKKVMLK